MFELAYPWALALFAMLLPLIWYYARFRKYPSITVPSATPFATVGRRRISLPNWCYFAAAAVLVVALARPRFGDEKVVIRSQGIDMILALDLSGSMATIDVPPDVRDTRTLQEGLTNGRIKNRLEVAKEELRKFVQGRPNDRIGLIGFAPMAYSIVPPTLDHGWLIGQLDRLQPGLIGDQTGLAAPLASGIHRLKNSAAPRRVLVLFTDGRNNVDNRLTPQQAAELGKESGVTIHTVGIGSDNAYIPVDTFVGRRFQPVADEFDEEMLRTIAGNSGGQYFHANDADGMKRVMDEINQLETTSFEQPKFIEYREIAPDLALLAVALLACGFLAESTWKLQLP